MGVVIFSACAKRFIGKVKKIKGYVKEIKHSLKNGDRIEITYLPSCGNVRRGTPNPYIGMSGTVDGLDEKRFNLITDSGAWLANIDVSTVKYKYIEEAEKGEE